MLIFGLIKIKYLISNIMKLAVDLQRTNDINTPCYVGEMFEIVWYFIFQGNIFNK